MRARVTVSAVSVAVLLATITACGGSGAGSGAGDVESASAPAPAPSEPPGGSTVRLLEPGAEPRDPLRYAVTPGAQAPTTMKARTAVKLTIDGHAGPRLPVVPIAADVAVNVGSVAPNGDIDGTYTMQHFRVDGPGGAAGQRALGQLDGLSAAFTVNTRGETVRSDVRPPPGLDPTLADTIEAVSSQLSNLTVPFPAEPVGVGARWTGRVAAKVNGIETTADITYALTKRSGADYVIDATYRQGGPPQKNVALPGLPADASADVDTIDITGTSSSDGSLTQLLPGTATTTSSGTIGLTVHDGQRASALREAMNITLELHGAA